MNASAPIPESRPADERANEPSMDEILASIRRIIADDQVIPLTRPGNPAVSPVSAPAPAAAPVAPTPAPAAARPAEPMSRAPSASPPRAEIPIRRYDDPARSFEAVTRRRADAGESKDAAFAARLRATVERDRPREEPRPAREIPYAGPVPGAGPEAEPNAAGKLLSASTRASVASSFSALAATAQSDSIETTVRDMLRPMLQQWLDDNLPSLVERLVRAEIERVARGGR